MDNALYYDRLCLQRKRQLRDPDDVLLEAEHRKQELAEEQKRKSVRRNQHVNNLLHRYQRLGTEICSGPFQFISRTAAL